MKTLFKLLTALFLMSMVLMGCDDDEKNDTPENYLKVGNTTHELVGGQLVVYVISSQEYGFELDLYTKGFSFKKDDKGEEDWVGEGYRLDFEAISSTNSLNGEFTFSKEQIANTFSDGEFAKFNSSDGADEKNRKEITSGIIKVTKTNTSYIIEIKCEVENNGVKEPMTGYFSGPLNTINDD